MDLFCCVKKVLVKDEDFDEGAVKETEKAPTWRMVDPTIAKAEIENMLIGNFIWKENVQFLPFVLVNDSA